MQCFPGSPGEVPYGEACGYPENCRAGAECMLRRYPDGGVSETGSCQKYCKDDSECPVGETCKAMIFQCASDSRYQVLDCSKPW